MWNPSMGSAIPELVHHLPGAVAAARRLADAAPGASGEGGGLSEHIGEHTYWCPFGEHPCAPKAGAFTGGEVNVDTVVMTAIVMGIILLLALLVRSRLSLTRPRGAQNALEYSFEFVNGFVADNLGNERVRSIGPLAVALFLFILLSNWIGLIPIPLPNGFWHSPTSDPNTTVSFSIFVFLLIQVLSIRARRGGGYVKHFFEPFWWLAPINIIEELSKPVTLSMRLFGNIFAGEILLLVFGFLLTGFLTIVALPFANLFGLALGLFVGAIQAFIFTVLTVAYIGIGTSTEGH